ncbi:hypothetical protein [Peribacillus cavernae]|uniref:hypothetical protein n=1 Tax=Peribacillus cavernae TaxID=1674310 RepID=UPI001C8EEC40|nr:hypothetical protein [Peribacillus cavernae]MDQ0220691.1 hypothetical protein [Peribacillus cavernae]
MKEILPKELVTRAQEAIKPIQHSASTVYQYGLAWDELIHFFESNGQLYFSEELANRFVQESKDGLDKGLRTGVISSDAFLYRFFLKY